MVRRYFSESFGKRSQIDVPKFWLFPGQIDLLEVIAMFKLFSKSNVVGMLPGSY